MGAAVLIVGALHAYAVSPPIQADSIYIVMLLSDLARHPHLVQWWLPPANGFFPDVLFGAVGYALGLHGFNDTVFEHALFDLWILLASYAWLRAAKIAPLPAIAAALLALSAFDLSDPPKSTLSWTLMTPTAHDGIIGFELLAAAAYFRSLPAALLGLVAIGVFSDRVMLAHFAAPIVALAALTWFFTRRSSELLAIAAIGAGAGVGWVALTALDYSRIFETAQIPYLMHFRFGRGQLSYVYHNLGSITGLAHGALYATVYVALIVLLIVFRRNAAYVRLLAAAGLMSTAALLTPIVARIWVDSTAIRYQLPFFLVPSLAVAAVLLNELREEASERWCYGLMALALVASVAVNAVGFRNAPVAEQRFAEDMEPLATQFAADGTKTILAQYWMAKPLLFASHYDLKVCQIDNDGDIYPWIADVGWCAEAEAAMRAASTPIAILDYNGSLDPAALEQRFGRPLSVRQIAGQRVFYYSPRAVEGRLRSDLARILPQ